jgi:hypothetical protein
MSLKAATFKITTVLVTDDDDNDDINTHYSLMSWGSLKVATFKITTVLVIDDDDNDDSNTHYSLMSWGSLKVATFKITTVLVIDDNDNDDSNTHYSHSIKMCRYRHVFKSEICRSVFAQMNAYQNIYACIMKVVIEETLNAVQQESFSC